MGPPHRVGRAHQSPSKYSQERKRRSVSAWIGKKRLDGEGEEAMLNHTPWQYSFPFRVFFPTLRLLSIVFFLSALLHLPLCVSPSSTRSIYRTPSLFSAFPLSAGTSC